MGVQQYYKLTLELYATLENGESLTLASIDSCSLVVRGRSPNHYLDIDIPSKRATDMMINPMMSATMSPSTSLAALSLHRTPQMQSPTAGAMFAFSHMTSPPHTGSASPNRAQGFNPLASFVGAPSPLDPRPQTVMSPQMVSEFPPLLIPQEQTTPISRQRSDTVSSLNSAVSLDDLCDFPSALEMPSALQGMMYPTDSKDFSLHTENTTSVPQSQSIDALAYPAVSFQSPSLMSPAAISDFGGYF
jgi:hypothetical protein